MSGNLSPAAASEVGAEIETPAPVSPVRRPRIAILHQGYIPHYRVRFFELLNRLGGAEYVVFHGAPPAETGSRRVEGPFAFPECWVDNREFRIGPWTAIYQPALRAVLGGGYDAVVLGHEIKFVSNLALALLCPWRGIAVLYWGFGYHVKAGFGLSGEAEGWAAAAAIRIKKFFARRADGYLAYTRRGAAELAAIGFPPERTFILQNTIDIAEQCAVHEAVRDIDPQAIRAELGLRPDSVVFAQIGRLIEWKRVDLLIEAVRRINRDGAVPSIEALIIGGGPLEAELKALARDVPGVHFLGALPTPPDTQVARCMKIAAAVVIPGGVGLAINHAFAQGRPLITRAHDLHGPEIEYLAHDENGLLVPGDFDEFTATLARFAAAPEWQARLAAGALRSRDELRLETMAERFDAAVRATVARGRKAAGVQLRESR